MSVYQCVRKPWKTMGVRQELVPLRIEAEDYIKQIDDRNVIRDPK